MKPELCRLPDWLGGAALPTYGLFLLLGILVATFVFSVLAGRLGALRLQAWRVSLETVLAGMLTARVGGLLLLPAGTPWTPRLLAGSAGVWYFGLLGGLAWLGWRHRMLGLGLLDTLDAILPAAALGHALGRVGCFFAGCCWGSPCTLPWAVSFPVQTGRLVTSVPAGVPLHPTQLYEAGAELLLGGLLIWWLLRHRRFSGQVALLDVCAYALVRFVLEFFRADPRGSLGPLSTSQVVAAAAFLLAAPALAIAWRRGGFGRRTAAGSPD